jgi:hypothetical protein
MNLKLHLHRVCASIATVLLAGTHHAQAGSVSTDFSGESSGFPVGSAYVGEAGGVGDSPCLKLTEGFPSQNGWFYMWDLDYGPTTGFNAKFKMMIGGGTAPADGLSFNFASDYNGWNPPMGEEGDGTGLSICFDTYDNGGGEAPAIDIKKGGQIIWSQKGNVDLFRTGDWVPVEVRVDQEGTLDLIVNNKVIVTGLKRAFARSWGYFAFGARAGGLTDKHFVDDIEIITTTVLPALPYVIGTSPSVNAAGLDSVIQAQIQDGQNPVDPASIRMKVDGVEVPITLEKVEGITTVSYDPPGMLDFAKKYQVEVSFSDSGASPVLKTETFEFTTVSLRGPNGNYYELGYQPYEFYTWPQAKAVAEARTWGGVQGHLATITDRAEDEFVELIRSSSLPKSDVLQEAWVGGFQPVGSKPRDNWQWIDGEGPIAGYENWLPGEPNDGYGEDSENYLTVGLWHQFGWNDAGNYNNHMLRGYIIEYEAIAMPTDFKPGDANNRVQASSNGKVNIAVLSTPSFDSASVVVSKLSAGRSGVEARPLQSSMVDVDADGDLDLLLQFNLQDLGLRCGDTRVLVFAENSAGAPLRGTDLVELLNCPPYGLTVTTLQDMAGKTDFYFRINSLVPDFTAPTLAEEIVLKSFNLSGKLTWTRTVKNTPLGMIDATTSEGMLGFSDLSHLQTLSARVQVRNSKTGTPEMAQADGKVLLRPDLQVTGWQAPNSAKVRQVVNVKAVVSEQNRDLGATCAAYLMAGDTVLDKAEDVKVNPGGATTVFFAPRFNTAGEYRLRVVVGDVKPGDFDSGNNSSSEFVLTVSEVPLTAATYELFYNFNKDDIYSEERTEWGITVYRQKNLSEGITEYLCIPAALNFPVDRISASVYSDGIEKRFGEALNFQTDFWDDGCYRFSWTSKFFAGGVITIQTAEDLCNGPGETYVTYGVSGGGEGFAYSALFTSTWELVDIFGSGFGPIRNFLEPQNSLGTYVIFDEAGLKFGGAAQITDFSIDSYYDTWNNPGENGTYSKGYRDYKSANGYSSGLTQP